MLRVLCCLEDYGEMVFLQILLKKLGLDVECIQNPHILTGSLSRFFPDLLIMTAMGRRVHGATLAQTVRKVRGKPSLVLLAPSSVQSQLTPTQLQNVDAVLQSPVKAVDVIQCISKTQNLDSEVLLEKYRKFKTSLSGSDDDRMHSFSFDAADDLLFDGIAGAKDGGGTTSDTVSVEGAARRPSPGPMPKRDYSQFLKEAESLSAGGFDKAQVLRTTKEMRQTSSPAESSLDEERMAFVTAMFRKKKNV